MNRFTPAFHWVRSGFVLGTAGYLALTAIAARPPGYETTMRALQEGNERFISGKLQHPHTDDARRRATAKEGQKPFAAILSCADSRGPVELIFDQGVGDLLVVRVAGNFAELGQVASFEFATDHFGQPVILVMGHTECGAMKAAIEQPKTSENVARVIGSLKPLVESVRTAQPKLRDAELLAAVTRANVWNTIETLIKQSPELAERVREDKLAVEGAIYDIGSGRVEWLGRHPRETELIAAPPAKPGGASQKQPGDAGAPADPTKPR